MFFARKLLRLFCCAVVLSATGCVGPVGCGPNSACGPLAFNNCDGCDQCDGCGELYIDPWINEPADACDPCDRCGNYNGQSCGKCRSVFDGFASLWGYRCDPPCDVAGPCTLCGTGGCDGGCDAIPADPGCGIEVGCGVEPSCGCEPGCGCDSCLAIADSGGDAVISIASEPTPARQITRAKTKPEPYRPLRTRQIFKPRGTIAEGQAISIQR